MLSTAVMVTVPVLTVAFAAKVRTLLVLSMKSPVPAGGTVDTVTVNGSADACSTVAVTVLEPPFSEIESGVNTKRHDRGGVGQAHRNSVARYVVERVFIFC